MKKRALLDSRMSGRFGGGSRKIRPQLIMGAVFLLAIPLVATSLAAQVTINGTEGGAVEFGQGNQVTVACDTSIQTSVGEIWSAAKTDFIVDTITLSNVDVNDTKTATTSNLGCGGKTLKVSLFNNSNAQVPIGSPDSSTVISFQVPDPGSDGTISSNNISGNGGGVNNVTASMANSSISLASCTGAGGTMACTYSSGYTTNPLSVGDYVSVNYGPTNPCTFLGVKVTSLSNTTGFSFAGSGCSSIGSGGVLTGKAIITLVIPATSVNLLATSVGRVALESQ